MPSAISIWRDELPRSPHRHGRGIGDAPFNWCNPTADATWARAHALVQDASGSDAAWVHAHLHRIEGDSGNARYWYDRADRPVFHGSLAEERSALIAALSRAG